jgi:hypothetical protein
MDDIDISAIVFAVGLFCLIGFIAYLGHVETMAGCVK